MKSELPTFNGGQTMKASTTNATVSTAPVDFQHLDDSEELARAELYGLLAQLWLSAPDAALLAQFQAKAPDPEPTGGYLDGPWRTLLDVMRAATPADLTQEHDALFQGVGKPEIFVYGSFYLSGFLNEKPLADLRTDLMTLGLSRDQQRAETEDHVAYGLEVMRYLIAGDDVAVCNLEQQRRFFRTHLQTWVEKLCDAVASHPQAQVWKAVAALTAAFMQVEAQAFDMLET